MASKKKLLFVMNNLHVGGAEKSLISLLQTIDYTQYEVDLQLFKNEGLFLKQVHPKVQLLPEVEGYQYFDMPLKDAVIKALRTFSIKTLVNRLLATPLLRSKKGAAYREQHAWKFISPGIAPNPKKYDAALGFLEKSPVYYVVEKTQAKRKIGFIHNDYDELGMDPGIDKLFFPKLDSIVTISKECSNVLVKHFPEARNKIKIIHNIVSPALIRSLSQEVTPEAFPTAPKIISVGRLEPQKGYDLAIAALGLLKQKGYSFHWIILGMGGEKSKMDQWIAEAQIEDRVSFWGIKENLYPYVAQADIFMQTSRFEGKSIAIDEAKILCKPILVTNFSTVADQITNAQTGIVAEMHPESIADKLALMLEDANLREALSRNLAQLTLGMEGEIEKIYDLF